MSNTIQRTVSETGPVSATPSIAAEPAPQGSYAFEKIAAELTTLISNGSLQTELVAGLLVDMGISATRDLIRNGMDAIARASQHPCRDKLVAFMSTRINDGDLSIEDIPERLVQFGLMDPGAFLLEMEERIAFYPS